MRPLAAAAGAVGLAGLGAAAAAHVWSHQVEIHRYTLREHELRILPPGARTIRLLHISDIHLMPDQHRKLAFLRHLASLRPHLVIDTGDNIASAASVPVLADALDPLLQRPGAYVMGSNDMFAPGPKNPARYLLPDPRPEGMTEPRDPDLPTQDLARRLSAHGWKDLTNTRACIELGGLEVRLAGVDDPHLERDEMPARPAPEPSAPDHGNVLRLGVAHAPYRRVLDAFAADGADLILAGHTHGGQLRLPGVGALVTNCDLPRQQARGLSSWQGVPLHVSAGMGASPYSNYRFLTPPEATLLTLRASRPDTGR
ncbi:metallophosphoesterase [Brachybacterium alimentarium]|uniref:Metallophosphoesterase n=1 Tax=Brachybacterium alimentarium TaxID=47845 RepID=A0A2A3YNQ3_9MICO|nr:metallophosphoesterase [Brachybacterium alimentarium]PCC40940.1 metallophosphoesterase [Brachybacterium alimentarium]RCS81363.1 metallophosphoesterase [Brachybacterium alimentarium]RCS83323.1 metallophosphoesterase [Brachybacterium alimentarium]